MLPNSPTDTLTFEIKEAKVSVEVSQLTKKDNLELKNKSGKKVAVLEFTTISNKRLEQSHHEMNNKPTNDHNTKKERPAMEEEAAVPRIKENAYVCILNWR